MYYKIGLREALRVILLNKEHLVPPRKHYTHRTVEYVMYVMVSGRLELKVNGEQIVLLPGDVRIFNKGDFQEATSADLCEYYYIHFESDDVECLDITDGDYKRLVAQKEEDFKRCEFYKLECYDSFAVYLPEQMHIDSATLFEYITNTLKNNVLTPVSQATKSIESRFAVSMAVAKILLKLERSTVPSSDNNHSIAKKIATYIEENYFLSISGADIEKEFYLNFDYANRVFKNVMGVSIIKYRNEVRLANAKAMILATDKPLSKIAADTGFENAHYFSRIFKKEVGVTPSEYKNTFLRRNTGGSYE